MNSRLVPINVSSSTSSSSPAGGGHHRQKLDLIRTSLCPFQQQQKWPIVEEEEGEEEQNADDGNDNDDGVEEDEEEGDEEGEDGLQMMGGGGGGGSNVGEAAAGIRILQGRKADMVRALVDAGYDQESAFYALKLVNFRSVIDASQMLASIKKNLVQKQYANANNNAAPGNIPTSIAATTAVFPQRYQPQQQVPSPAAAFNSSIQQPSNRPLVNVNNGPAWPSPDRLAQSKSLPQQQQEQQQQQPTKTSGANFSPVFPSKAIVSVGAQQQQPFGNNQVHALRQSQSFGPTDLAEGRPSTAGTLIRIERIQSERTERNKLNVNNGMQQNRNKHLPGEKEKQQQKTNMMGNRDDDDANGNAHFLPSASSPPPTNPYQLGGSPLAVQRIFIDPQTNFGTPHSQLLLTGGDAVAASTNRSDGNAQQVKHQIISNKPAFNAVVVQQQQQQPIIVVPPSFPPQSIPASSSLSTPNRCVSPLPEFVAKRLKAGNYERVVKPCRAPMFRFFMEQHIEKLLQQYNEREKRARQLNREMEAANLADNVRDNMLRLLRQKESKYLRMRRQKMNLGMFELIRHIGIGAFGKVTLVRKRDTDQVYAMKTLVKADVIQKQQAAHVKAERDILAEANSPWIVKLFFSFQDTESLYFCMEYVPGGDMMQLLINMGIFPESLAKFYIAELALAVEYVHSLGFIHRDIKPDNILIDKEGHIKLTDFGLCTGLRWTHDKRHYVVYDAQQQNGGGAGGGIELTAHFRDDSFSLPVGLDQRVKLLDMRHNRKRDRAHSVVGTGNYMAPEVIQRIGHTQLCDWWSVGVILYEMCYGRPPFMSQRDDPAETQYMIVHWRRFLDLNNPMGARLSRNCVDCIARLCCDQEQRIGHRNGAREIKAHPWFKGINFADLRNTKPEYVPRVRHPEDTSNFDTFEVRNDERAKWGDDGGGGEGCQKQQQQQQLAPNFIDFTFRHFFSEGMGPSSAAVRGTQQQSRPSLAPFMQQQQQQQQAVPSSNKNQQKQLLPSSRRQLDHPNQQQMVQQHQLLYSTKQKTAAAVPPAAHSSGYFNNSNLLPKKVPPTPSPTYSPVIFSQAKNAIGGSSSPAAARTVLQIGLENKEPPRSGWRTRYPVVAAVEQPFRPFQARLEEEIEPIDGEEEGEEEAEESQC